MAVALLAGYVSIRFALAALEIGVALLTRGGDVS